LGVDRIDHGVRCVDDESLITELATSRMPLTVCPLSNVRLCVYDSMLEHPILDLLAQGVCVTVNSDDPSYFGGYLCANYEALSTNLQMTQAQAVALSKNSFEASFISAAAKQRFLEMLEKSL
jgi:adenosine deaminase